MSMLLSTRTTSQQITTEDRVVRQISPDIAMVEPDSAVLVTILMKTKPSKACKGPKLEWMEDDYATVWATNSANTYNSSATSIVVADATLFLPGDLFVVPKAATGNANAPELIRVTAVDTGTNTLTVVRNVGGGAADSIPASCDLRIVSSAFEENSAFPSVKMTAKVTRTAYTQIIRTATDFSNTAIATETHGAPSGDRVFEHKKKLVEHKRKISDMLYWGRTSQSLTGGPSGYPIRTMQGLRNVISTNILDAGGMLTKKRLSTFARMAFRFGTKSKVLFSAPTIVEAIHSWATSQGYPPVTYEKWGVPVSKIVTPYGTWALVRDWMLEDGAGGYGFGSMCFSVDLEQIHLRHLSNNGEDRNTTIIKDAVKDGRDGKRDEIRTELASVIMLEKNHAFMHNVTDYME